MFVRTKTFANKDGSTRTYLQIVTSERANHRVRQRVIANLGRVEDLQDGQIDRLIEGLARFSQQQWVKLQANELGAQWSKECGPALIFRRLWEQLGLAGILGTLVERTEMQFPVDEAVFAMVLNRLCDPLSKLALPKWTETVRRPEFEPLQLHHFYRALDFLVEHKAAIEDGLFARGRDLFHLELDLVFWDTTSTYLESIYPSELLQYGYSKDHRPDRLQVLVGVLMTRDGYPVAHQVFPGNTADVDSFRAALAELKSRFQIRRVVLVGDLGMVSEAVLKEIREARYEYIVGVRMRRHKASQAALRHAGRYRVLGPKLRAKEVRREGERYIVCFNPEQAKRDRLARETTVAQLQAQLEGGGLKSLVGNRGYRRFLKVSGAQVGINEAKLEAEARYDGRWVLRTNTGLPVKDVVMAYKGLWQVERAFRTLKSALDLRPMHHWTDRRIRGHIMVCFLALVLQSGLTRLLAEKQSKASYGQVLTDLRRLHAMQVQIQDRTFLLRTELEGHAYEAFRAVGMRPPVAVLEIETRNPQPAGA